MHSRHKVFYAVPKLVKRMMQCTLGITYMYIYCADSRFGLEIWHQYMLIPPHDREFSIVLHVQDKDNRVSGVCFLDFDISMSLCSSPEQPPFQANIAY